MNIFVLLLFACVHEIAASPLYQQAQVPVADRVVDLLTRMNIQEKINELHLVHDHVPFIKEYINNKTGLGGIKMAAFSANSTSAMEVVKARNEVQQMLMNSSRLGIPTMFVQESLHSGSSAGTVFPMPCLMGASWNPDLIQQAYDVIARETRAIGADLAYAPVLQVFTDPRFGRTQEGFSEDPFLVSVLGAAATRGLQGGVTGGPLTYLDQNHVTSLAKHYAAYGRTQGGLNASPADMNERTLREVYLKPWKAYAQAGGRGAMPAHNTINNVPCHSNTWLLDTVFRKEFGIEYGVTISDCNDIGVLVDYRVAANKLQAAALGAIAGVDLDLMCGSDVDKFSYIHLMQALKEGLVNETTIDRRVMDVLTEKFASGLFDNPLTDESLVKELNNATRQQLALTLAEDGIVLVQNNGTLPIEPDQLKEIAIIGPLGSCGHSLSSLCDAQRYMLGSYLAQPSLLSHYIDTLYDVISNQTNASVKYSLGANIDTTTSDEMIDEAVDVAKRADLVVLAVGDSLASCGEWRDRDNLDLPGAQLQLLKAVADAVSNPQKLIVIIMNGRPATFGPRNEILTKLGAVLVAWRPGQAGATALWNIITGKTVPSGKLTQSWPRSVGQVGGPSSPWFALREGKWIANGKTKYYDQNYDPYVDEPSTPLFPFGFGLSYTTFNYTNLTAKVVSTQYKNLSQVIVTAQVSLLNTGKLDSKEIIQLYITDPVMNLVRYWKRLIGFKKVAIKSGSRTTVDINIKGEDLAFYDENMIFCVVPGEYMLVAGGSSVDTPVFFKFTI